MPRTEYAVPLPASIGCAVTDAVRSFADQKKLRAEVWVHDLPLWFVTEVGREPGVVRRVQIVAYRLDRSDELRLIPQVFRLDRDRRAIISFRRTPPELIGHLELREAADSKKVEELLHSTWQSSQNLLPPTFAVGRPWKGR